MKKLQILKSIKNAPNALVGLNVEERRKLKVKSEKAKAKKKGKTTKTPFFAKLRMAGEGTKESKKTMKSQRKIRIQNAEHRTQKK